MASDQPSWLQQAQSAHAALRNDRQRQPLALAEWSERITEQVETARAVPAEDAPAELVHLYALSAAFAQHALLPSITTSPHRLIGNLNLDFQKDLDATRQDPAFASLPEPIIGSPSPAPHGSQPESWSKRARGIAEWLEDRIEVYDFPIDATTKAQIRFNCYCCAVALAACAWGWADTLASTNQT